MNNDLQFKRFSSALFGTPIALGLIISAIIVAGTIKTVKLANQTITVKGYAEKRILSDLIVWDGNFKARGTTITDAYQTLASHQRIVKKYLSSKGIQEKEVIFSSVETIILYGTDEHGRRLTQISGYELVQKIQIQSGEVDKIASLAREITELINQGVQFSSSPPKYFYTKLGDLKVEMLGEATRDARTRAEELAQNSKSQLGKLRAAFMGVFQITAAYSTEVSDYGIFDTSTKEKDVKAVVTVSYSID